FAYFRPFTKVSARPGTRGMPAQAETHAGAPVKNTLSSQDKKNPPRHKTPAKRTKKRKSKESFFENKKE
ncbi:hypothetical protein, partial [Faecalispora jeddahensis]|uniref:hypothetical protein n=1 Tax=Faecalispora jeddahensis TaxID=1414721 RepID=UPI0028A97A5B